MSTPKFSDFINSSNGVFQHDAETLALHRAYDDFNFKLIYEKRAKEKVETLIAGCKPLDSQIPSDQTTINAIYERASKNAPPAQGNFGRIVQDWLHFESRFFALLRDNGIAFDEYLMNTSALDYRREVQVLCCYLKVKCDAARPWQYSTTVGGITGADIINRWNGQIYQNALCNLPLHAAYPSGHACVAYMHAALIARTYPHLAATAHQFAGEIADRRIEAGLHFQRDIDDAKALIDAAIP